MKKFFENKYIDHLVKWLLTTLAGVILYFVVEVYTFIKFKQVYIDTDQNKAIMAISEKQEQCTETQREKDANQNSRIDQHSDKFNSIDRKLDLIMYRLGESQLSYNNQN